MNDQLRMQIEMKLTEAQQEIMEVAHSAIEKGEFLCLQDGIALQFSRDVDTLMESFLGIRLREMVRGPLEELFDMPIMFRYSGRQMYIRMVNDKKSAEF